MLPQTGKKRRSESSPLSWEKNKSVPALMQLAMLQEQKKDFPAARDAYEKLLTIAPRFPSALNNLAVLYSEHLGELDKAYDLAKRANEAAPNEPHLADTLGWILFKKGDYSNALRLLQGSASKLPDHPEIQFHAGMANYMMGEEGPARLALQKAVNASADFPGKDEARQRLALLAIHRSSERLRCDPNWKTTCGNGRMIRGIGAACTTSRAGRSRESGGQDYEKVVTDYPLYAPATRQLAKLYAQRSTDDPKAYDLVTKARQAYPDDPEIAKALGILNYRRQYYPQSSELLKEAAAKRKDDPELLYYLGDVYRQLKQYNECKEALQRALDLNLSPRLRTTQGLRLRIALKWLLSSRFRRHA